MYAVGHDALAPWAAELAVIMQLRRDAVISHRSAVELWGLGEGLDGHDGVEVTVIGRDCRARPGLSSHRVPRLHPHDVRLRHGIPVTAPARTLIDLAAGAADAELERSLSQARVLCLVDDRALEEALERTPGRTGAARLRILLGSQVGRAPTRSTMERALLRLVADAGLSPPRVNAQLNGYEVDLLWPAQRLVVEADGWRFHGGRRSFERDRRRDQALGAAGYRVIRITWRQLEREPLGVVARIAQALVATAI